MTFQALLVSKDEEAIAVLNPVLAGFELNVQSCGYPEAMVRISEQKYDAVLVDFDDPHSAALLLQNVSSIGNGVVTVALLSDKAKVRNVFGAGANFVLYKPISEPQAQASLRAATALIKRERRRACNGDRWLRHVGRWRVGGGRRVGRWPVSTRIVGRRREVRGRRHIGAIISSRLVDLLERRSHCPGTSWNPGGSATYRPGRP